MKIKDELENMLAKYNIESVPEEFDGHITYEKQEDGSLGIEWVSSADKATELLTKYDWPISIKLHVEKAIVIVFGKLKRFNPSTEHITEVYHSDRHPAIVSFTFDMREMTIRKSENWYQEGCVLNSRQVKKHLISLLDR
jgi:hypothetical protein